jgi:hypothetical protein
VKKNHQAMSMLVILFAAQFLWGCGNDVQGVSTATSSDTVSASLAIRWHETQHIQNSMALQSSLDCQDSGIESVVCNVYDTLTDTLLVTGGPWACETHGAAIKGIPVGQDRTFVLLAQDSKGNMKWRGEAAGVTIIDGEIANVAVDAYPFIPSLIFPNNGDIVDPNAFSLAWEPCINAVAYIVQVSKDEDFFDIVTDQTTTGSTYALAILKPSTEYYWRILGVDLYDNIGAESEARHFITADCTYSISSTENTIGSDGGTGRFDISTSSASCAWRAEASAAWVTITSESSGIGDGTVTYTVSANAGDGRTAVITIAGQTHTVNQDTALGSLKVKIYPSEAVSAGARWRVDGGDWNSSGDKQKKLSVGNHLVEFNTIPGWLKPTSQTVTIKKDQTTDASGEYSQSVVIDLSVYAYSIMKNNYAYLTWSGADSKSVDIYRDDSIIDTTRNDGAYNHGPFKEGAPATYQICESGTSICSNRVTVSW